MCITLSAYMYYNRRLYRDVEAHRPTCKISPSPYTSCLNIKCKGVGGGGGGGRRFSSIVKIRLHINFFGSWGKCALRKYFRKWRNLVRFGVYFNVICHKNIYFLHKTNDVIAALRLLGV